VIRQAVQAVARLRSAHRPFQNCLLSSWLDVYFSAKWAASLLE